ncbi:MAG TPA: nicotinamide-nucleotide amidohydrolase family protein [bacterium]|nr:nicotinamide-nucleotide amidohydrolase family protein [bacterium]
MRAAVLLVGDEILSGVVRDLNLATIARALAARGIAVERVEVAPDTTSEIAQAAARLAGVADLLFITGGLGPTDDDRTREGLAQAMGVTLETDPVWEARILDRARSLGLPAPKMLARQATFPRGTIPIENPVGSAPGFHGRIGACEFFVMPGVPREVEAMMSVVLAHLPEAPPDFIWECIVATAGLSEVRAALSLEEHGFEPPAGADLGFLPGPAGVRIKLFSRIGVEREAMAQAEAHIRRALSGFEIPVFPLEQSLVEEMHARGFTLATAESCTGGLLGARITDVPGASSVYLGGVVAYANSAKAGILGVDPETIRDHGAVSEPTALAMAKGCRDRLGADLGVSVTGVAGPDGGTPVNPVGSVWIGVADQRASLAHHFQFSGNREMVRERSVAKALELVWRRIRENAA